MSHSSKIFDSQPVEVQNLNGFDLSHINCGTAIVGKLTPVLRKLIMPSSKFSLGLAMNVELPPLATAFFGRIDAVVEVFFCPCAILYGGWKQFISNQVATMFPADQETVAREGGYAIPVLTPVKPAEITSKLNILANQNKGLADYLGIRVSGSGVVVGQSDQYWNLLPFLAYHKIWDVFYRNASVTRTIFAVNPVPWEGSPNYKNVSVLWHSYLTDGGTNTEDGYSGEVPNNIFDKIADLTFPDGKTIFEMRQRNWSRGYFTAGSVNPQQGNPSTVKIGQLPDGDGEGVTIAALRAANSLQKWLEAMNYDPTYRGIMRNHFGVSPSDAELDEPSYIGRVVIPVYQKSVYQNQQYAGDVDSPNPFSGRGELGAKGASGSFSGEGQICKNYKVRSFGYLMGIFSLVPHAMYGYGADREMFSTNISNFPFPELQSVGMDAIKRYEVYYDSRQVDTEDFAYIGRYSWMKYIEDSVHGELRPGKSLQSFVLQRYFAAAPSFGTAFLEIPETALDGVFAATENISGFSCWYEIYWVFKCVMPLAAYCVPTLGDLKDTHTIKTTQGGSRL